jgi:prevent-host-death family protein
VRGEIHAPAKVFSTRGLAQAKAKRTGRDDVIKIQLKEAEGHLGDLIEEAAAGREVVITSASGSTVRLVPLREAENEEVQDPTTKMVGHSLDRFIGTWSAEQEAEVLRAVEVFERVDDSFWQ